MDQLTLTPEEIRLRELTAVELAPDRQAQLAEFLLAEIHEPPRRSRRRVLGIIGVVLAAITLTGGVAYAWISSASPDDPHRGYCYTDQNPDRGENWQGTEFGTAADAQTGALPPAAILETCASIWRQGIIHAPGATPKPGGNNPVPHLVVCVNAKKEAVVFPGPDSLCDTLGLANLAPDPTATP